MRTRICHPLRVPYSARKSNEFPDADAIDLAILGNLGLRQS